MASQVPPTWLTVRGAIENGGAVTVSGGRGGQAGGVGSASQETRGTVGVALGREGATGVLLGTGEGRIDSGESNERTSSGVESNVV